MTIHIPEHLIATINRVVRTSRQMLPEIGREPRPEELAGKLAMPLELLTIANRPISLDISGSDDYPPPACALAQLSRRPIVRLKTRRPGVESGSRQK